MYITKYTRKEIEEAVDIVKDNIPQNTTYSFIIDQRGTIQDPDGMIVGPFVVKEDGTRVPIKRATDPRATEKENLMIYLRNHSHCYICRPKYTSDGNINKMYIIELEQTNRSRVHYGAMYSTLMEVPYDIFVKFDCDVYYKSEAVIPPSSTTPNTDYIMITISITPPSASDANNWEKWSKNKMVGSFQSYEQDGKLYSMPFVKPTVNLSYTTALNKIKAKGPGFGLIDYQTHKFFALLFWGYYCSLNSQEICGYGTYNSLNNVIYPQITGSTNELGMTDTNQFTGTGPYILNEDEVKAGKGKDIKVVNFWGLEQYWGSLFEFIEDTRYIHANRSASIAADENKYVVDYITAHNSITILRLNGEFKTYNSVNAFKTDYPGNKIFITILDKNETTYKKIIRAIETHITGTQSLGNIKKLNFGKYCDIAIKAQQHNGRNYYFSDHQEILEDGVCARSNNSAIWPGAGIMYMNYGFKPTESDDSTGARIIFEGTDENIVKLNDFVNEFVGEPEWIG